MKRRILNIALALLLALQHAFAQNVLVEAQISSLEMLIGEQVAVTVSAIAPEDASVVFPQEAELPVGIEFLGTIENPSEHEGSGMMRQSRSYVLTSFADTLYSIPPFVVTINDKEFKTKPLALKVLTVEVDTTDYEKYYGPKGVQDVPFSWSEDGWDAVFWLSCVLVLLLVLLVYLYLRLISHKPIIARIRIVKRLLPHQKAMKAIEEIKAGKMATGEDPKTYYTMLTDTLRQYMVERYGFNAMEMTSSEIINRLMSLGDPALLNELRQLFQTADLVKFAKYSTLINENDANLVNAIEFINQTKIENMPTEEAVKPALSAQELRSQENRLMLKIFVWALVVVGMMLFGYIIYFISQIL